MTKLERVYDSIVTQIESGALTPGDRLPSEEQLATRYRVSVGTVQKALSKLAHFKVLSREHGRGTFVSGTFNSTDDVSYLRFCDRGGRELPHYITLVSLKKIKKPGPWSNFLGTDACIRIARFMSVGGKVNLFGEFWLRVADFQRLKKRIRGNDEHVLERNLRVVIAEQLSLPTLKLDRFIRFERPPKHVASHIGIEPKVPAFILEMYGYTFRQRPLFYQCVYAPPFSERLIVAANNEVGASGYLKVVH
jgi:GntR family transcriptional regulator